VPRDRFVAALRAEGVPASGDFYAPVYRDPLFAWRDTWVAVDYSAVSCPVAERAAYEEGIWLPHQLFLGGASDVEDIAGAVGKIVGAWKS